MSLVLLSHTSTLVVYSDCIRRNGIYEDSEDDDGALPLFANGLAPQLDTTGIKEEEEAFFPIISLNNESSASHRQQQQQQQQANDYTAPTPREWKFQWDSSPKYQVKQLLISTINHSLFVSDAETKLMRFAIALLTKFSKYNLSLAAFNCLIISSFFCSVGTKHSHL